MSHFNDNVLNILKSTKKLIDRTTSQKAKKDMKNIAFKASKRFCNECKVKNVNELSEAVINALEEDIWCSFEVYGH